MSVCPDGDFGAHGGGFWDTPPAPGGISDIQSPILGRMSTFSSLRQRSGSFLGFASVSVTRQCVWMMMSGADFGKPTRPRAKFRPKEAYSTSAYAIFGFWKLSPSTAVVRSESIRGPASAPATCQRGCILMSIARLIHFFVGLSLVHRQTHPWIGSSIAALVRAMTD